MSSGNSFLFSRRIWFLDSDRGFDACGISLLGLGYFGIVGTFGRGLAATDISLSKVFFGSMYFRFSSFVYRGLCSSYPIP
jgi:hypothetical protein